MISDKTDYNNTSKDTMDEIYKNEDSVFNEKAVVVVKSLII